MKLSIVMMAAAAVYAAPQDDQQAALAPDSPDRDMQALLSMDSFNITSADSEQNRMHAVCDMEYRLSKMTKGVVTTSLMAAGTTTSSTSTAASLFNPFTMPLMAVKQHIALLQQEEKFLQAQSDAFSGSSSATTAAPSDLKVISCDYIDATTTGMTLTRRAAGATKIATDNIVIDFTTTKAALAGQILQITLDSGSTSTAPTVTLPTIVANAAPAAAVVTGVNPCFTTGGADAACVQADGSTAMGSAGVVKVATTKDPQGVTSVTAGLSTASTTGADVKTGNNGVIVSYTLAEGIGAISSGGLWFLGAISGGDIAAAATVTMEFQAGTATGSTLLAKGSCTTK